MADKNIFIFGLGYVGRHLAASLYDQGWQISGTSRDPDKLRAHVPEQWQLFAFEDGQVIDGLSAYLENCSHVLSTIPALMGHDPVMRAHADILAAYQGWTGYVSATSVYPDQEEGFVDETTEPAPATKRGRDRLAAEQQWLSLTKAEIFRAAGIYGPRRNPFKALADGSAKIIDKPGHYFNRIHQSDITKIIIAAIHQPRAMRIINLCDNEPAPQGDVIGFAAKLMGIKPPVPIPFEQADLSPMARSFYVSRRKLKSNIIARELAIKLDYPTYREGLSALFEHHQK